jgi:hypothetical protein
MLIDSAGNLWGRCGCWGSGGIFACRILGKPIHGHNLLMGQTLMMVIGGFMIGRWVFGDLMLGD